MINTYYIANPEHEGTIYGNQSIVCLDLAEVQRLAREWDMTTEEMMEQMREATAEEIEKCGVYDS